MGGDDSAAEVFAAIGAPAAVRAQMQEKEHHEVWPENWPAVQVFCAMQTQWRIGMGPPTGLDYSALPSVMDLLEIEDRSEAFRGMRVMEIEALEIFRKRHART